MKTDVADESKPLLVHLKELRKLLIAALLVIAAGIIISFVFLCSPVIEYLEAPLRSRDITIIYTGVSDAFGLRIKCSIILGIIITSPVVLILIWRFIRPALYESEVRLFRVLFFASLALFIAGIVFCYLIVYSLALDFFLVAGEGVATPYFSIDRYLNFLLSFLFPFGVAFELPVVIYMLAKHGLVTHEQLASCRKYVILLIVIVSAILTPPDVVSQIMLSIPVYLLFEAGVMVSRLATK
ncbi:MAG: twin-arginine translocase subunit TatC [Lachnospiraceae bacterium]|nr:twin-arginine translocase subunit TatC [Lachnospiraceae bacterium]